MLPLLHTDNAMIFLFLLHVVDEMILHDVDDEMQWDNLPTYPENSMQPSLHLQVYVMKLLLSVEAMRCLPRIKMEM